MYNEEQQERGVELMIGQGLQMNRIIHPITDSVIPNAEVSTVEDGEIWCGDLSDEDMPKLQHVAAQLKRTLIIQSHTANKTLKIPVPV